MIQFLRGTQAALNSSQQIFPEGQPIYEKDTHQLKIGDGVNSYSGLPYIGSSSSSSSYEIHLDPSNPHWNGYVDLNGSIRLVFGRTTAHLVNVSGTMKSQSVLSADGELRIRLQHVTCQEPYMEQLLLFRGCIRSCTCILQESFRLPFQ